MGLVECVCLADARGPKSAAARIQLKAGVGVAEDVHGGGDSHRQVSFLTREDIDAFDPSLVPGSFGENVITRDLDLSDLGVGTLLRVGKARLAVSQLGKACHSPCQIYRTVGDCIMPRKGIFCRVLEGGTAAAGDSVAIERLVSREQLQGVVLVVSDSRHAGERKESTGQAVADLLEGSGWHVEDVGLVPDEEDKIAEYLTTWSEPGRTDVIFTAGGTGFSTRDVTPEATRSVIEREAPGLAEATRVEGAQKTDRAWLSRGVSGIRKKTIIVNLPGSPKGSTEGVQILLSPLAHGVHILRGQAGECGKSSGAGDAGS